MRKAKFSMVLVALGWLCATPVTAVDFASHSYAGIATGLPRTSDTCIGAQPDCRHEELSYEIISGYHVSRWFSVETAYVDMAATNVHTAADSISKSTHGFTAALVTTAPILEKAGLFGKFGVFYTNVAYQGQENGSLLPVDFDDSDWYFGVAARYPLGDTLGLSIEWERFFEIGETSVIQNPLDAESVHDVFSASLFVRF